MIDMIDSTKINMRFLLFKFIMNGVDNESMTASIGGCGGESGSAE